MPSAQIQVARVLALRPSPDPKTEDMDKIPKYEERDLDGWDQFFAEEFQRLGLITHEQKAGLVHAHLSAYLDSLDYEQLYMLRLSILLEDENERKKNAGFLEMIAAQMAILESNRP